MTHIKTTILTLIIFSVLITTQLLAWGGNISNDQVLSNKNDSNFCVIINSELYEQIQYYVDRYIEDVTEDGYQVELYPTSDSTPESLRTFLQEQYVDGLEGCIFIGDLPIAWYYTPYCPFQEPVSEEFPCDLFYMDLDGIFEDTDNNGIYDSHTGNVAPEIWMGRLTASPLTYNGSDEISLMINYFEKNHRYRAGGSQLNPRALVYIDDDFLDSGFHDDFDNDVLLAYDDIVLVDDPEITWEDDYKERLSQQYELIQPCIHSSPVYHTLLRPGGNSTNFYSTELYYNDPQTYFVIIYGCTNARYTTQNYMAGWYAFSQSHVLAALGSAKSGSMVRYEDFYTPFGQGSTIGEAFKHWFWTQAIDGLEDYERCSFGGMTLIGDPTLTLPKIYFIANQTSGNYPLEVQFSALPLHGISVNSWQWDFDNDGIIDSQDQNPVWTYTEPGDYTLKLIVEGDSLSKNFVRENYIKVFNGETALLFDGRESFASCPASPELNLTESFTIEAWINPADWGPSSNEGRGRIIDKDNFAMYLFGEGNPFNNHSLMIESIHESTPRSFTNSPVNSIDLDSLQHVAVSYEAASNELKMYINGVEQVLTQTIPPVGSIADNSEVDLKIGNSASRNSSFDGTIDELRIWNTVRTSDEIHESMNVYLSGNEEGLVSYWQMNEGSGDEIFDSSINENHASFSNIIWMEGTQFLLESNIQDDLTSEIPEKISISQNYPNPFNPTTTIQFTLPEKTDISLKIYDVTGKLIKNLADNEKKPAGYHQMIWHGKDENGRDIPSGLYFYQLEAKNFNQTKSMLLLK